MREFLIKIFRNDRGPWIELFNTAHILYLVLIIGLTITLALVVKNKFPKYQAKVLNIVAVAVIATYIADFFIMPISRVNTDPTRQLIDPEKLPFQLCTFMGVVIPFVQFNRKLKNNLHIKEAAVVLSIAASLMYLVYPGSAIGEIGALTYKVVQTFLFHGLVFCWGLLNITFKEVTLRFKNMWKPALGILVAMLWASFGNVAYYSELFSCECNFCFLKVSFIPFIPDNLMPVAFFAAVYSVCAMIYGINWCVKRIAIKATPLVSKITMSSTQYENI